MTKSNGIETQPYRIWLICEGKHEQGGALQTLFQRLRGGAGEFAIVVEPWKNPRRGRRRFRKTGKGDGVFKKLVASLIDAEELGYDAVVILIDRDGDASRVSSSDRAQATEISSVQRAFGLAIETFDAWFTADELALSTVCNTAVQRQPEPETVRDPKNAIAKICVGTDHQTGTTNFYAELAKIVDLEVLQKRCPKGFATWADRVRSLNLECNS